MSMREDRSSSHHRRTFGTAPSSQHYYGQQNPRAAAATTRMGYNHNSSNNNNYPQNTVSSYATTAVNSATVPAAWQLPNDPLTFPPLTLQTPPLLPPSAYASAQHRGRYHHHNNKDLLSAEMTATAKLFDGSTFYHPGQNDDGVSSESSRSQEEEEDRDSRRSDEPFSDRYLAARERARLLQQGTDVENMAHLFPLPPSRKGPLANMTPPSSSHGRHPSGSPHKKGGPLETSWLTMHD
ncbi:uncharacterized protein PG998_004450 [Apiospora kogelbergensis]|uniref:Uncharacterized protein n=1 Tax=Apiospora kogelbergensis TaxID=1337665 RepID=A0AAW0QUC8_9PEZI